jgi:hypothetical protein
MNSKYDIFALATSLVIGLSPAQMYAQYYSREINAIQINDSTSAIELPSSRLRILFPKPLESSYPPKLIFVDGIVTYFLGDYEKVSLTVEISSLRAIRTKLDSLKARRARKEPTTGDEMPPETEQEYIHRKTVLQQEIKSDYFDSFDVSHGRVFGIRAYRSEVTGSLAEGHTYLDSLQLIFRISSNATNWSNEINFDILRRRLLPVLSRIQLEKM